MSNIYKLIGESGVLFTRKAIERGISKYELYSFIRDNGYEKIAHGVYALPDVWLDETFLLSLKCPAGVISHDEALYYHGLIDREPMRKTVTVYTGYGTSRLIKAGIKVFTVKNELLDVGKVEGLTSCGNKIPIYNLERSICDLVRSRRYFEFQDFQTALRAYVARRDKDLNRLMEYAKLFHVDKIIKGYMGVLL